MIILGKNDSYLIAYNHDANDRMPDTIAATKEAAIRTPITAISISVSVGRHMRRA